jgi:hypothetical protein
MATNITPFGISVFIIIIFDAVSVLIQQSDNHWIKLRIYFSFKGTCNFDFPFTKRFSAKRNVSFQKTNLID